MTIRSNRWKKKLWWACFTLFVLACVYALLFIHGAVQLNNPSRHRYPVRGVDVSSWQGDIDWEVLAGQDIQFAFIKATEGSIYRDRYFQQNWSGAAQTDLYLGAYHFFSYDSTGEAQAKLYIRTVPREANRLPPVVDLEFYAGNSATPPEKDEVTAQLNVLLQALEEHYGKKPIIYATMKSYRLYLSGGFDEYPIWIRSVYTPPRLPDSRRWSLWQYTARKRLKGYSGRERFIDMNAYHGTLEEFKAQFGLQ